MPSRTVKQLPAIGTVFMIAGLSTLVAPVKLRGRAPGVAGGGANYG